MQQSRSKLWSWLTRSCQLSTNRSKGVRRAPGIRFVSSYSVLNLQRSRQLRSCKIYTNRPVGMLAKQSQLCAYLWRSQRSFTTSTNDSMSGVPFDSSSPNGSRESTLDLQTSEAMLLFDLIFKGLAHEKKPENMVFPKRIMWLSGAPGSGKSEMTEFIMQTQGIETEPINVGSLLKSESLERLKSSGSLVHDREVITALLRKLLEPQYSGRYVLVDGFPRTLTQAHCISLLYDNMLVLRRHFEKTEHFSKFPRPVFHVTVLYVDEKVSIERQLERGIKHMEHNRKVKTTGVGTLIDIRETDLSEAKARFRYAEFHSQMYHSLQLIQKKFPFHFINAEGTIDEVKHSIEMELAYQSKAELADSTFDNVRRIPLAGEIKKDARLQLVQRLDAYEKHHKRLFDEVIATIIRDFIPVIKQQALTGQAILRSENPIFFKEEGLALRMVLDLLSERGYRVVLDYLKDKHPERVDLNSGQIVSAVRKVLVFHVSFPPPKIRHATAESVDGWDTHIV